MESYLIKSLKNGLILNTFITNEIIVHNIAHNNCYQSKIEMQLQKNILVCMSQPYRLKSRASTLEVNCSFIAISHLCSLRLKM